MVRARPFPEALFDAGYIDRSEITGGGLKNQCSDLHMRARGWAAAAVRSPQPVFSHKECA